MIESKGKCAQCADTAKGPPGDAAEIGQRVVSTIRLDRGSDETEYSFRQCPRCGSVWMTYTDSGAGGHGRFHKRLTEF